MRRKLRAVLFTFLAIGMGWAGSPAARAATDDLGPGAAPAAAVSSWPQFARAPDHPNTAPAETAFTPDSVSRLGVAWIGQFGVSTLGQGGAAVVGGLAYVGGTDGVLSVFRVADCAGGSCTPAWTGVTGGGIFNTPAVAGGLVLVGSTDHFVYAFPAAGCGATTCPPRWRGRMADAPLYSSIAVAGGVAYIGDAGGRLYAFPVQGCGRATCTPSWVGRAGANEQLNTAPAVAGGFVYVGSFLSTPDLTSGRLLAFRATGCGSAACRPTWTADLLGPSDTTQAPLVSGGVVFASSSTRFGVDPDTGLHVFAFAAGGCGAAVCRPLRAYETGDGGVAGGLALSGGTLFASLQASPDPNTIGVVAAYPAAGCGRATCPPRWTGVNFASGFESPPVVTGGVVLVAKGPASGVPVDAAVLSYAARGCGAAVCLPLSFTQLGTAQFYFGSPIAVADGTLFVPSGDTATSASNLYALRITGP